jgi:hypothetical protein
LASDDPGLDAWLDGLVDGLASLMGPALMGVYLHGSLAQGGYVPGSSDVDLLIVQRASSTVTTRRKLVRFWLDRSSAWRSRYQNPAPHAGIEVSHLLAGTLDTGPRIPYDFHYSEDHRGQAVAVTLGAALAAPFIPGRDVDLPAHFMVVEQSGRVLSGPAWAALAPPVPRRWYLESLLADIQPRSDGTNPDDPSAVLNACRTLRYLVDGRVTSKVAGGEWAVSWLRGPEQAAVATALAAYRAGESSPLALVGARAVRLRAVAALSEALAPIGPAAP